MGPLRVAVVLLFTLFVSATVMSQTHADLVKAAEGNKVADFLAGLKSKPALAKSTERLPLASQVAMTECIDCMRALLDAGVSPRLTESGDLGRGLLHLAAGWSNVQMVRLLVDRGADVNARTKRKDTVLSFAAENFLHDKTQERTKIVEYLRAKGAK